jgi:hypothetical protein
MQSKKYVFCDCAIEIEHNAPIAQKNNYNLFLQDFEKPDFSVEVIETEKLPEKTGERLFKGELIEVYSEGEVRKTYSAFPTGKEQLPVDFACRVNNESLYISFYKETNEFLVFEGLRLPELLLSKGIGILHCSFIEVDGQAILFAGDKQVGKSTQASLWEKYGGATVINGDRAGLFIKNGRITAGGVPYCGTSGICKNKHLPLKAIVCPSKGTENKLQKISPMEAFMFLLGKFAYNTWDTANVNIITDLLSSIVENVPVYSYSCLKDESAVKYLSERI